MGEEVYVQRWRGLDRIPSGWGRCVVTIGVFDGVHRGHQVIIGRAVERGRAAGIPTVVLTFDPHPTEVLRPGSHPAMLSTMRHRSRLLEAFGVDVLCVLPFTLEFSRLEPDEFVHDVLVEHLHAAAVVVGENFRFGRRQAGDVDLLRALGRKFGFTTEGVSLLGDRAEQEGNGEHNYSSTYVRACVDAGDVESAAEALGRPHRIEGVVVRGDRRGRDLGYPTANLAPVPHAAIPSDGVYAGWLVRTVDDREERSPAAISVGTNPTFEGRERRVEAYALPSDADVGPIPGFDLYGEHLALDIVARLRDTERFDSVDELIAQMRRDVARTRRVVAG